VSFRISCKCTGSLSRYFSTQELSRIIGVGLSQLLGWKPDLKNPQLEASSFDKHYQIMGFLSPFLRLPLANRCYTKTTGLRSTVAWAMASLAQIQVVTHTGVRFLLIVYVVETPILKSNPLV
uniref:Uncharacterized protein n=1 Tax=Mola mola TaxID=94237 RepID=A0A3Q3W5L8_MOLML